MHRPILALIHDLADAIALGNPEQAFLAGAALAERVGPAAAAAIAEALATEARPLETVLKQTGLTACA